jgi:phage terminase large subunit-like protein
MRPDDLKISSLLSLHPDTLKEVLGHFNDAEKAALFYKWELWARPEQLEPPAPWRRWLNLGGRGAGKTRTGAEWVRKYKDRHGRIALVGQTAGDVREVMVEGPSGIMAISPPWDKPFYEPSKRRLTWPNGAVANTFSGDEPDQLRGPNLEIAWCDELAKFKYAQEAWDNLIFGLRVGSWPRVCITTTPRPIPLLRKVMNQEGTVLVRSTTYDNRANLAPEFFDELSAYEGTRLGRQELYAELLTDMPGALWTLDLLDAVRVMKADELPEMKRIVVGIDPSGTAHNEGAQQGIVVCGAGKNGAFYVIDDCSCSETPQGWARQAVNAFFRWGADCIVAERNFGGDMVKATIQGAAPGVPIRMITASRGKHIRAEPIAALYERGRVRHIGYFAELEAQLCQFTHEGYQGRKSPDRADALVHALSELSQPRSSIGIYRARY